MKKNDKKTIKRECELKRRLRILITFPHIWVCVVLALATCTSLVVSFCLQDKNAFLSSIFANIFAGLITGLAICLISGTKQIFIARMKAKKAWLQNLADLLKIYMGDYHKMIRIHFDKFDGNQDTYDFYYDMSIHAHNINVEIHQSVFNKTMLFNSDKYCRKTFGYDSDAMSDRFDELHAYVEMIDCTCPSSKEIAEQFQTVHSQLHQLNSGVYTSIREIDIRLTELNQTII